jgi:hypothetical protein
MLEVLSAVNMNITVLYGVTSFSLVYIYPRFGETSYLFLHGWRVFTSQKTAISKSKEDFFHFNDMCRLENDAIMEFKL